MKPSPKGSKILSGYAAVFCGVLPALFAGIGLFKGMGIILLPNVILGCAIIYFAARVFRGDPRAVKPFAILVMIHYFGITLTNVWNYQSFPIGTRAQEMAIPRMIRGVVFGSFYAWYYLMRQRSRDGFDS